jgi:serine/threonine-protein kinase RsbW
MDLTEKRIANRLDEMPKIVAMVERFGTEHGCPNEVINDLNVALDEILSNVIAYGYGTGESGEILVRLDYHSDEILIEVEDDGKPFDPLQAPPPELRAPLHARQVGGLGIHFIKSLMDEVAYARTAGKNRLELKKRLPAR